MPRGENNRKLSDENRAEIVRLYTTRSVDGTWMGAPLIARQFGVCHPTVYRVLRLAGVERRDAKEAYAHGKRCKPITSLPPEGASPPECKCGCGQSVSWNRRKRGWNRYFEGHYRKDAPYKREAWLRKEYVDKKRPTGDIAFECGVTASVIPRWLAHHGIERRQRAAETRSMPGSLNPAWKGGVTPERQRLYRSQVWRELVRAVLARDGYRCQRCGAPKREKGSLHAHHLRPWADDRERRMVADNLITLCRSCHGWVHSRANVRGELLHR